MRSAAGLYSVAARSALLLAFGMSVLDHAEIRSSFDFLLVDKPADAFGRSRLAEVESLKLMAAGQPHELCFFLGLHALGNDVSG